MHQIEICHNSNFQWDIVTSNSYIATDRPQSAGGDEEGPSPEEIFLSSLGAGCAMRISSFLKDNDLENVRDFKIIVTAVTEMNPERLINIRVSIVFPPGFPHDLREKLISEAEKNSVLSTVLMAPSVMVEEFSEL